MACFRGENDTRTPELQFGKVWDSWFQFVTFGSLSLPFAGTGRAARLAHFLVASARKFQTIPVMIIAAPANTKASSGSP